MPKSFQTGLLNSKAALEILGALQPDEVDCLYIEVFRQLGDGTGAFEGVGYGAYNERAILSDKHALAQRLALEADALGEQAGYIITCEMFEA